MNPDPAPDPDMERRLRALQWREPPPAVLARSLAAALAALPDATPQPGARPQRSRISRLFPAPVRWTLAACWALNFVLRLTTPALPGGAGPTSATARTNRPLPGPDNLFFAALQTRQIHELQREIELARR